MKLSRYVVIGEREFKRAFEEKGLKEEYGEEYRKYRRRVLWRIIPRLF